jgi:hypothetical protein
MNNAITAVVAALLEALLGALKEGVLEGEGEDVSSDLPILDFTSRRQKHGYYGTRLPI